MIQSNTTQGITIEAIFLQNRDGLVLDTDIATECRRSCKKTVFCRLLRRLIAFLPDSHLFMYRNLFSDSVIAYSINFK